MFMFQIFLPVRNNDGHTIPKSEFDAITQYLTERFGGVTAYLRSPARGTWQDSEGGIKQDDIVVYEVLAESIDHEWWTAYRRKLESAFQQQRIIIHAQEVSIL
jgi:hypothetical protein